MIKKLTDLKDLENARIKYSSILSMKNSEGEIQWNRYNAMLMINTIFITLIGLTSSGLQQTIVFKIIVWILPILGLVLCHLWHKMTERGFIWTQFWIDRANKIENEIDGKINPIQEGKKLRDIIGVGITKNASFLIIKIFALIYFLMLINNILLLYSSLTLFLP